MYGNDYEYARTRVERTILSLSKNNEPVYIEEVDVETGECNIQSLSPKNNELARKVVHLEDFNYCPPRLGYCNTQGVATYVSRIPMRRDWKQGLRRENMFSDVVHIQDIPYKDLAKCMSGEYPSMIEVYNHLTKQGSKLRSMAFHRHWAMDKKLNILYKHNKVVGKYDLDKHSIDLNPEFHHLAECLQESL